MYPIEPFGQAAGALALAGLIVAILTGCVVVAYFIALALEED